MPFSSLFFVCAFLPLCLANYWLVPARWRNYVALLFSLLFYAWGAPRFLPVIFALGIADYALARGIARTTGPRRRWLLVAGVCVHISILAYFKYANFAVAQFNSIRDVLHMTPVQWKEVVLPIGVSFLTFEEMSYLIDVYRGDAQPAQRGSHYLLFLMLFPHSIAGPIFRWKDLAAQLANRETTVARVLGGMKRFSFGLAKKVIVADSVAHIADAIFGMAPGELSAGYAWIGAVAYAIQIYFDFSGYSDMAIGLGQLMGFTFRENFREPYASRSITEFWTRWHISLSTWMRDYLYIPLGGNRMGRRRAEINAFIVFSVSGFWHGAAWTFLIWGMYHGLLVALERRVEPKLAGIPGPVRAAFTFIIVVIGWVFFRANTLDHAVAMLKTMSGLVSATAEPKLLPAEIFPHFSVLIMAGAMGHVLLQMFHGARDAKVEPEKKLGWRAAASVALLALSIIHMTNTHYTPLIYFKF